jgi:hypothetical protein
MKRMTGAALGLAMATMTGASATAQERIGDVTATIDGAEYEWHAYAPDPSGTDYNTSINTQFGMPDVSVMGFLPGEVSLRGVVQLTFMVMPGTLDTLEQEVIFAPEGMSRMWTSLDGEDLIEIESLDTDAPEGAVSGRFAGQVCRKDSMMAPPDPETCKQIEGRFSARLPHVTY